MNEAFSDCSPLGLCDQSLVDMLCYNVFKGLLGLMKPVKDIEASSLVTHYSLKRKQEATTHHSLQCLP